MREKLSLKELVESFNLFEFLQVIEKDKKKLNNENYYVDLKPYVSFFFFYISMKVLLIYYRKLKLFNGYKKALIRTLKREYHLIFTPVTNILLNDIEKLMREYQLSGTTIIFISKKRKVRKVDKNMKSLVENVEMIVKHPLFLRLYIYYKTLRKIKENKKTRERCYKRFSKTLLNIIKKVETEVFIYPEFNVYVKL